MWEKWSRTVNPYENSICALSPTGHACRQFSVTCFHFLYMHPVFFICTGLFISIVVGFFFYSHLFWVHGHAFFILPKYCGQFLSFQIRRNAVLHICYKSKYAVLRGPLILVGWQILLPNYNTDQVHFFLFCFPFICSKNVEWCKNPTCGVSEST